MSRRPQRKRKVQIRRAKAQARELLRSPDFFNRLLGALEKLGLVGEQKNALILYIVCTSRLLERPLNAIVKGASSTGKNWLVTRVFQLLPRKAVKEITSTSAKAWNYAGDEFRHKVVYLQERNEAVRAIHPARLLISEGRLRRVVTTRDGGDFRTKTYATRGPIASISTTTQDQIELDDETRHISLWVDESTEQTKKIVKSYLHNKQKLTAHELVAWRQVQRLLARKARSVGITFPGWFDRVAERVFVDDVRARRYFPAFVEACRVVCLLRSFQRTADTGAETIEVAFADFAVTALIFDSAFTESLHRSTEQTFETRQIVERISSENGGRPVDAKDVAEHAGISLDRAYNRLRRALSAGTIRRANRPEESNRKLFLSSPLPRFVPHPKQLFSAVKEIKGPVRFVHPITGKRVVYRRESTA